MTAGVAEQSSTSGQVQRRPTNPVVDLRYLFTTWATDHRDEHQLLGAVLRCILAHSSVPASAIPAQVPASTSLSLSLVSEDARVPGEFWSSLDGRLKPGLQVTVSLPVDVYEWAAAGPPATSVVLGTSDMLARGAPGTGASPAFVAAPAGRTDRPWSSGPAAPAPVGTDGQPLLRRRRSSGVLTMEGRPGAGPACDDDSSAVPQDQGGAEIDVEAPAGDSGDEG